MRKSFFYTGKSYTGEDYKEHYTRASRWARIDYTPTGRPYIRHDNRRYYLENFLRAGAFGGTATEIKAADGETVTLAGYEIDVYYKPYFIEIDDSGDAARLYRFEGTTYGEEATA